MSDTADSFRLEGKSLLITGGSSGIGKSTAIIASTLGARVIVVGRNEVRLAEVLREMGSEANRSFSADLSQGGDRERLLEYCEKERLRFDGVVFAAGIQMTRPLAVMNMEKYEELFRINVFSQLEVLKGLLKKKKLNANGSSVVFVSAVAGLLGRKGLTAYSASKGAIVSAIRPLALELAPKKIRVNAVCPGLVHSEMAETAFSALSEEQIEQRISDYPLGLGRVEDVAHAISFLLGDCSKWMTGTNFVVDGGRSCR